MAVVTSRHTKDPARGVTLITREVLPNGWSSEGGFATFNHAESSNFEEVRMKVRQAYEGRVIEARSSELKDGGWNSEFSIEEHESTGVTETTRDSSGSEGGTAEN
jgi:hypothetical protein